MHTVNVAKLSEFDTLTSKQAAELLATSADLSDLRKEHKQVTGLLQRATEKLTGLKESQRLVEEQFRAVLSDTKT